MKIFGAEIVSSSEFSSLKETLVELERQLEDIGWVNINSRSEQSQDMARESYERMVQRSRLGFIKSPLVAQAVNLTTFYTFGSGIQEPKAKEGDAEVQDILTQFWNDPDNVVSLTSSESQLKLSNKLQYDGEIAFVLQVDTDGSVYVRIVDPLSIFGIVYDATDSMRPLFYKRRVRGTVDKFEYIPDASNGAAVLSMLGVSNAADVNFKEKWDAQLKEMKITEDQVMKNAFVMHVKVNNDSLDTRGVPEVWRALDWINSNSKINSDMGSFINAQSQYAVKKKIKGTKQQVQAAAGRLRQNPSLLNKPSYAAGATIVENEQIDTEPIGLPSSTGTLFETGIRRSLLMVCAAFGIMEHYFGDPSTGNLATTTAMELPMLKKFLARQKVWEGIYMSIINFQLDMVRIKKGVGAVEYLENRNRYRIKKDQDLKTRGVDIDFPPILEKDIKVLAEAFSVAKREALMPVETAQRMFMMSAGVNNIDDEMSKEFQEPAPAPSFGGFGQPPAAGKEPVVKESLKQVDGKWFVYSSKGKKMGGPYASRGQAAKRLAQVEYFKSKENRVKESVAQKNVRAGKEKAVRLADKNRSTLARMDAYLQEIADAYRAFDKGAKENFKAGFGAAGTYAPQVKGVEGLLAKFKESMLDAAARFLPEAVRIGRAYAESHAPAVEGKVRVMEAKDADAWTQKQLAWNRQFVEGSLIPAMKKKFHDLEFDYSDTVEGAQKKVAAAVESFETRVASYAAAFWTVEENTVQAVAADLSPKQPANFIGVDDENNCQDCQAAIEGNPWPADEIPIPGNQQCLGNCRHAIQIIGDDDLSESDLQLLRESEEMYRNGISILKRP